MDSSAITLSRYPLPGQTNGSSAVRVLAGCVPPPGGKLPFAWCQPAGSLGDISAQAELLDESVETPDRVTPESSGPRWFVRALAVIATIAIYSIYRQFRVGAGRAVFQRGLPVEPFRHALTVLKVEHALWLDVEQGVQDIFLAHDWIIRFSNGYYSWSHQVMTLGLVIAVLMRAPWRDARRWVGALLLQLPVGLVLFRLYPLMPPRLLDAGAPWGGRILQTHRGLRPTGIVDTLVQFQGPWSPGPVQLNAFTNQYAAMPSLHCAFSLWVGIVWWQWAKGKPWRMVGPAHSAFMFFCVVVTGNHFVLDAVAGWAVTILMLAVTGRFVWLKRFRGSLRADRELDRELDQLVHGDSNLMPSMTATSQ